MRQCAPQIALGPHPAGQGQATGQAEGYSMEGTGPRRVDDREHGERDLEEHRVGAMEADYHCEGRANGHAAHE